MIRDDFAGPGGWDEGLRLLSEHRLVWEAANGPIPDGYIVHHRNHDKLDNRLENLTLATHQEHGRLGAALQLLPTAAAEAQEATIAAWDWLDDKDPGG